MKKLLKLLFVLSGSTTLPLAVVACGQQSLDSILNIIKDGDTKYSINEVLDGKEIEKEYHKTYSLSTTEATLLAKTIAEKILVKAENKTEIKWADEDVSPNEKAYSFKIIEEKHEEEKEGYTWATTADTGTFNFKINYLVGTINDQKQFNAVQQISMSFDIKWYYTESDKIVEEWIKDFEAQIAKHQPLDINLEAKEIDLPKKGSSWSDLDNKVQSEVNGTLNSLIKSNNVGWKVQSNSDSVVTDNTLEIFLSVNKKNVSQKTKLFIIKFN